MLTEIEVVGLIDRLQAHALADAPGPMSDAQVDAAIAMLDRVMPDLAGVGPPSEETIFLSSLFSDGS